MNLLNRHIAVALGLLLLLMASLPTMANAAPTAIWTLSLTSQPTNFVPGSVVNESGVPQYNLVATNVGGAPTSGLVTVTDTLPPGLTPVNANANANGPGAPVPTCSIAAQTVTCTSPGPVNPGRFLQVRIGVSVDPLPEGTVLNDQATVAGGGAPTVSAVTNTTISTSPAPFGFLSGAGGLSAFVLGTDGSPATQASSHPHRLIIDFGLGTQQPSGTNLLVASGGGVRDVRTDLPLGLVANPTATPVLCTEAQLQSGDVINPGCPAASQVGTVTALTRVTGTQAVEDALYNMVPPPEAAAAFGFNALGLGVFVHVLGGVRAGDYALSATANDILSRPLNPVLGVQAQLWGDPSSSIHDTTRDPRECGPGSTSCAVTPQKTPFLSMPSACSDSLDFELHADSWSEPGKFLSRKAAATDTQGNPTSVSGCEQAPFDPSIDFQPTTAQADSPSGMDVELRIPQTNDHLQLSSAHLKRAIVTLPEGMALNPSAADGLAGCNEDQIGLTNDSPIEFDLEEPTCPDGSKVGDAVVTTPLLKDPLKGTLYVADPANNPFDTLLSGYLVVEGPGIVVKIAGRFDPDPQTGRIVATFDNNPQLPFSELDLHFKGGNRGVLITPPACGTYEIESKFVPWSVADPSNPTAVETVTDVSTFTVNQGPNGQPCPSPGDFRPSFEAGTLTPLGGAYSPFVVKLSRDDGMQRLKGLNLTLPPGVSGKLAGVPVCPEAAIGAAEARSGLGDGALEQAGPSCPASSQVGTVLAVAGAGSQPYHTQGKIYLAGPYKGAPLSFAIVTPAVAGPFDLGVVVVRAAAFVNERTAQITVKSDPAPTILQGIPLALRSIVATTDRPTFTLNPTSCEEMSVNGEAISALDQVASLFNRFQVGGCQALPFKPRLAMRLIGGTRRGAHPKLQATLTAKPGEANIARASVALPRSEFLDQAHIRTVCTRVQFAADQCPQGAIYGHVRAFTPLLDESLEGPVYLRSSDNELPDAVGVLKGPASRPIQIEVAARIDSIRGGIRANFETTPDAPVSKVTVTMQGGRKGLLINSENLCEIKHTARRATVKMDGQNGKTHDFKPLLKNKCGKNPRKAGRRAHRR